MPETNSAGWFATTQWSVVLAASDRASAEAGDALESLCRAYWRPLYAFLRQSGQGVEDARDLTQGFFEYLLERNVLAKADPRKGRFRSFLLSCIKNFAADARDKAATLKRGGGQTFVPFDIHDSTERCAGEPSDAGTPDKAFERRWALTVLEQTLDRVRADYVSNGRQTLFDQIKDLLFRTERTLPYAETARSLGMNAATLRSEVCRLRRRYQGHLWRVVAETVAAPEDVEDEIRHLILAVSD